MRVTKLMTSDYWPPKHGSQYRRRKLQWNPSTLTRWHDGMLLEGLARKLSFVKALQGRSHLPGCLACTSHILRSLGAEAEDG